MAGKYRPGDDAPRPSPPVPDVKDTPPNPFKAGLEGFVKGGPVGAAAGVAIAIGRGILANIGASGPSDAEVAANIQRAIDAGRRPESFVKDPDKPASQNKGKFPTERSLDRFLKEHGQFGTRDQLEEEAFPDLTYPAPSISAAAPVIGAVGVKGFPAGWGNPLAKTTATQKIFTRIRDELAGYGSPSTRKLGKLGRKVRKLGKKLPKVGRVGGGLGGVFAIEAFRAGVEAFSRWDLARFEAAGRRAAAPTKIGPPPPPGKGPGTRATFRPPRNVAPPKFTFPPGKPAPTIGKAPRSPPTPAPAMGKIGHIPIKQAQVIPPPKIVAVSPYPAPLPAQVFGTGAAGPATATITKGTPSWVTTALASLGELRPSRTSSGSQVTTSSSAPSPSHDSAFLQQSSSELAGASNQDCRPSNPATPAQRARRRKRDKARRKKCAP